MKLGVFSVSLAVKNLETSKQFYEKIGFSVFAGNPEHNYLIMKNGSTIIGLFQGMFEKNILTFNPGWDENADTLENYTDVRELNREMKKAGLSTEQEVLEGESGPGSFVLVDPDGNPVLIDQHV